MIRKLNFWLLPLITFMWFPLMFAFAIYKGNKLVLLGIVITSIICWIVSMFIILAISERAKEKIFLSTYEDLLREKNENEQELDKAKKLIKIIGEHEAVKMWNGNKDK